MQLRRDTPRGEAGRGTMSHRFRAIPVLGNFSLSSPNSPSRCIRHQTGVSGATARMFAQTGPFPAGGLAGQRRSIGAGSIWGPQRTFRARKDFLGPALAVECRGGLRVCDRLVELRLSSPHTPALLNQALYWPLTRMAMGRAATTIRLRTALSPPDYVSLQGVYSLIRN